VSARAVPPSRLWWLAAGFGVWCSALVVLYALHAIGCAFAWRAGPLRVSLGLVLLAHLIVIAWMWRRLAMTGPDPAFGQSGAFLHTVVLWTLIAAFVATALTLGPPLLLTGCMRSASNQAPITFVAWTGERGSTIAETFKRQLLPANTDHEYFIRSPDVTMDAIKNAFGELKGSISSYHSASKNCA